MILNVKRFALVLSTALALGGLGTESASAVQFHSEVEPTRLTASQPTSFNDSWGFDAGSATCENASYVGSMNNKTTSEATLTPTYTGCTSTFGTSVTFDPNGCQFKFTTGGTKELIHIVCPTGSVMEWTAPGCTITVPPQTIENGITWTNSSPKKDITANISSAGLAYEEHNKGFFPTCKRNTGGIKGNGTWVGAMTIFGESFEGVVTNIWRE